jgi:hypothetical protein
MTEYTVNGASAAMNTLSESYKHFAQSFSEQNDSKSSDSNSDNSGTPSVIDQATKGNNINITIFNNNNLIINNINDYLNNSS